MVVAKKKTAAKSFRGAETIEKWPLERLKPYARNSRTHSDEQIAKVAASIERFGFTNPILVAEDGTIIAGHGRALAAKSIGLSEVPVIVAGGWTDAERRAYVIADNQLALEAGWDEEVLRLELSELRDEGFDLSLTGFGADDLAGLLDVLPEGATDPEETPDPPLYPVAMTGDLWALGRHRLICGDATSKSDTARLIGEDKPHLMVTDPPYGVDHDPTWRERAGVSTFGRQSAGLVENDNRSDWREAWALFDGDVAYVWQGDKQIVSMAEQLVSVGFSCRNLIVWAKPQMIFGRGDYHTQHETCWYVVRKGRPGGYCGGRKQTTLWSDIGSMHVMGGERGGKENPRTGHSTQKPIECMKRPIENNSKPGDAVYEPFSGSGTTIVAAEMTGRRCLAIEISPAYVDVAITRWQNFTGQKATLMETGQTFDQVAKKRKKAAA